MAKYRHSKGPSVLQVFLIVLIVLVSLGIIGGAAYAVYHFAIDKDVEPTEPTVLETLAPATVDEPATEPPTEDPELKYTELAKNHLSNMSEDEKIYQMLVVTPETLTGVDVATIAGDTTKEAIKTYPVGGIYYSSDNFEDDKQTKELIEKSQSYSKIPMLIGVCEEGGENSPVASKLGEQGRFEDSIYKKEGDQTVLNYAGAIAKNISTYGFNFNLSPSANIEGENSFPSDPKSDMLCSAVKGFNSNGVIATPKMFPIEQDSDKDIDELRRAEFLPFATAIEQGVDAIMVGSATLSAIEKDVPAFMSQRVVTEVLIKELKFDGVVVTPNLSEMSLTDAYETTDIVVKSINAGANLLLCPDDIDAYAEAIKEALKSKTITIEQIDESVTKILALKYKYGIIPQPATPTPSEINTETVAQTDSLQ